METNRADRLADALSSALTAKDRRRLLEMSEPTALIAKAIRRRQGSSVHDASIPASGYFAGSCSRVQE